MSATPRIIAYYPGWSVERSPRYCVADIPADRLTHVNYAFADVSARNGQIAMGDPWADIDRIDPGDDDSPGGLHGNFNQFLLLKERHPHLKTLISIGGWAWSDNFSDAAATHESRLRFARSCAAFASRYRFDGIDIDWEYPGSDGLQPGRPEDSRNFTLLLAELRRQLDLQANRDGCPYLLTIASPAGLSKIAAIEVDQIHQYLDFINIMTYDFAGAWSPVTSFNAPLYGTSSPLQPQDDFSQNAHGHAAVEAFLEQGTPPDKLVLGAPFYGRGWQGVSSDNDGLFQLHEGAADLRASYRALVENDLYGMSRFWHEEAKVPWLYDSEKKIMVSYDDPESMRHKGAYVRQRGLGGAMFWELTGDDADHSLLRALTQGLTGAEEA
jgi:chitinase